MPSDSHSSPQVCGVNANQVALFCRIGSVVCALPAEHVSETMRPLPLTPVDRAPSFVDGIAIIRGAPVPVVDLARLLGIDSTARRARFVIVKVDARRVALSVEHVIGVRALDAIETSAMPPLLSDVGDELVTAVGRLDAQFLVVLELTRIVHAEFLTPFDHGGAA